MSILYRAKTARLTNIRIQPSMFSARFIRPYFLALFLVTLCYCFVRHAVLTTRFDSTYSLQQNVDILSDRQMQLPVSTTVDVLRPDVNAGDVILPLSYPTSNEGRMAKYSRDPIYRSSDAIVDDTASRQNNDVKEPEAILGHFREAAGDSVASSTIGKQSESDELSALFGAGCNSDKLGLPVQVAQHCAVVDKNISDNAYASSSRPPSPNMKSCAQLTCRNILSDVMAAENHSRIAAEFTKSYPFSIPTDGELAAIDKCDTWRTRYGFNDMPPVSSDEVSFPLAFNVLTHQSAHQLARLLRAIYRPHNVYCIHVDALSAKDFMTAVTSLVSCFDNVRLASRLERVVYAGFSRLQADINCMKDHNRSATPWRYLINTAGQAFPLRTNAEMVKILRLYNGSNDIEGIYGARVLRSRFENEWIENGGGMKKTGKRNPPPPDDIDIVRGSAYGVFSRSFVRYIIEDRRARNLLEWSRKTWSPDEFYWSTLHHTYSNPHLRTPGAFSGYPSDKQWLAVYANWGEIQCHGQFVRGVCVFGVGDLPTLVRRKELFANKFYVTDEPIALDCLEAWLRHKEICPPKFDYDYYSKLAFIAKPLP